MRGHACEALTDKRLADFRTMQQWHHHIITREAEKLQQQTATGEHGEKRCQGCPVRADVPRLNGTLQLH